MSAGTNANEILKDVNILGELNNDTRRVLTKDATAFLALLHRSFNQRRKSLLQRREIRQAELDKGTVLDFLPETRYRHELRGRSPDQATDYVRDTSARMTLGREPLQRLAWWTGGLRSQVRRTARWLSTPSTRTYGRTWQTLKV